MLAGGERSFWSPCTSLHAPGVSPARCFRAWVLSVDSCRVQSGECQMRSGPGGRGLRRRCNRFDQYSILGELFRRWDPHFRNQPEASFQLGYYAQCPHRGTRHGPRSLPRSPRSPSRISPFYGFTYLLYTPLSRPRPGPGPAAPARACAPRTGLAQRTHGRGRGAHPHAAPAHHTHPRRGSATQTPQAQASAETARPERRACRGNTKHHTSRGERGTFAHIMCISY